MLQETYLIGWKHKIIYNNYKDHYLASTVLNMIWLSSEGTTKTDFKFVWNGDDPQMFPACLNPYIYINLFRTIPGLSLIAI